MLEYVKLLLRPEVDAKGQSVLVIDASGAGMGSLLPSS